MRVSLHQCELRRIMDFFQFLVLVLHITQVFTKSKSKYKKHQSSSSSNEGSIENLLYYKDCQRNAKEETTTMAPIVPLRVAISPTPPPQPACRFPKMCCALTCGNECGNTQNSFVSRQMDPVPNNVQPPRLIQPIAPLQPQAATGAVQPKILQRKKKIRIQPIKMQPVLGTRRDMSGFTKQKIKGLISQDDDIRKILKDLVRVTMQKVDLLDMINTEKSDYVETASEPIPDNNFDEYDE